jgi:hypothetical protein
MLRHPMPLDVEQLASQFESMAAELRENASAIQERATAMDVDHDDFVKRIADQLQHLRASAGLPDKDLSSTLRKD